MKKFLFVLVALLPALQGAKAADTDILAKGRAIWCEGNKTLYFAISDIKAGDDYNSQKVTKVYDVDDSDYAQTLDLEWQKESESDVRESVEKVVFIDNFIDFKPVKCKGWFYKFKNLKEVVDLKNLNTSNVTNMDFMFSLCESLTTIDVNDIDLKNVTAAESMFAQCSELTTIYCNNEWKVREGIYGASMFADCGKLKGGVAYDDKKITIEMATPKDGYFTARIETKNDLAELEGWYGDVTLDGLSLYKDGAWNTIVLPFDVTLSGSPLAGAVARPLESASISGTTLNLTFGDAVTTLEAGTPYIIKWESGDNIVSPVFNGVIIKATDRSYDNGVSGDDRVRFLGTYKSTAFTAEDYSILLMGGNNTLYYPSDGAGIGAQRAYFKIGDDTALARQLTSFSIDSGDDDDATGIISLTPGPSPKGEESDYWHTLDGRRIDGKPSHAGVYINNGKKVVIK